MAFEQVANYVSWDARTLRQYLNGTWSLSPTRAEALEHFLVMNERATEVLIEDAPPI
jgi:hypothetical protein